MKTLIVGTNNFNTWEMKAMKLSATCYNKQHFFIDTSMKPILIEEN